MTGQMNKENTEKNKGRCYTLKKAEKDYFHGLELSSTNFLNSLLG